MGRTAGSKNTNGEWLTILAELRDVYGVPERLLARIAKLAKIKSSKPDTAAVDFAKITAQLLMDRPEGKRGKLPSTKEIEKAWKKNRRDTSWIDHHRADSGVRSKILGEAITIKMSRDDIRRAREKQAEGGSVGSMHGPQKEPSKVPHDEAVARAKRVRAVQRRHEREAAKGGGSIRAKWVKPEL